MAFLQNVELSFVSHPTPNPSPSRGGDSLSMLVFFPLPLVGRAGVGLKR